MSAYAPTGSCPHLDLHPGPGLHQRLAALREHAPVVKVTLHGRIPAWLLTRAADVERALTDPRLASDDRWLHPAPGQNEGHSSVKVSLMGLDGAEHTRLRRILARPFTPRNIESFHPRVQALTDELVDRIEHQPTADLIQDLALPLPLHVICDILGIPPDDRDPVHQLTRRILAPESAPQAREDTRDQLRDYLGTLSRHHAATGILAHHGNLTTSELTDAGLLLLMAGHETTTALIGSILLTLLERPAHYQALTHDPSLIPRAVDEIARLHGPVALGVTRYSTADITISGTRIPAGQRVLLSLGAADRDPARWTDPDRPDLARRPRARVLAFGQGPHYCLGAGLARMEAQTTLATLTRRVPHLALAEHTDTLEQPGIFHGPARLPVRLNATPQPTLPTRESQMADFR
ncbi:cytochrome P450 [Streptomyces chartreusis]|uniref:cytochrome P450 n=1 Tax=Streptomyces chartreusis TaxID=1969 RepID=UPI002F910BE6|nr:cytochrome P450 [Streptomyces chartreusis]